MLYADICEATRANDMFRDDVLKNTARDFCLNNNILFCQPNKDIA